MDVALQMKLASLTMLFRPKGRAVLGREVDLRNFIVRMASPKIV